MIRILRIISRISTGSIYNYPQEKNHVMTDEPYCITVKGVIQSGELIEANKKITKK
jgi:hypothetical protein